MQVPLTITDFLDRAEAVYPDRVGFIDEPDQVAPSWGSVTYGEVARRARAQAAALDRLGVGVGERVAVVSHNSARLLTSFFGVSGSGRILVPVNFRLAAEEVRYIVEHSGASVLLVDPELEDVLGGVSAQHRFTIGDEADAALFGLDGSLDGVAGAPWSPDESATAVINYTSGTTARPKGWSRPTARCGSTPPRSAGRPGWTIGTCTSTRCRCSTATAGACRTRPPGWGAPGGAAQGRRRRDPPSGRAPRRHLPVRRTGRREHGPRRRRHVGRSDPRRRTHPDRRGRRPAAHPHDRSASRPSSGGSSSRSTDSPRPRRCSP